MQETWVLSLNDLELVILELRPDFVVERRVFGQTDQAVNFSQNLNKSLPNLLLLLELFEEEPNEQTHLLF